MSNLGDSVVSCRVLMWVVSLPTDCQACSMRFESSRNTSILKQARIHTTVNTQGTIERIGAQRAHLPMTLTTLAETVRTHPLLAGHANHYNSFS